MAGKKTSKASTKKDVQDTVVNEEEAVVKETEETVSAVEAKEESTSVDNMAAAVNSPVESEAEAVKEEAGEAEVPVKKRKYNKKPAAKTPASKTADKTTAKKAKKETKPETVQEVYIEFGKDKISSENIINSIQESYKNEGHRISSIKKLQVYMNIEERKAYYVINDKPEGKYVEF